MTKTRGYRGNTGFEGRFYEPPILSDFKPIDTETIQEQYESLLKFAKEKVFTDKQYQQFEKRLEARYKPSIEANKVALKEYLDEMRAALEEQRRLNIIDEKVRKKRTDYEANRKDDSEHTPGDLKVEWFKWMETLMGQEFRAYDEKGHIVKTGKRWNTLYDHHDNLNISPYSKRDTIREIIRAPGHVPSQIFHRPGGVIFREGLAGFSLIPKRVMSYDEALSRARDVTRSEVERNLRDIDYLLHQGYPPEHRKSGLWNEVKHRTAPITEKAADASEMFLDVLNWGVQKLGRGVFTKSDAREKDNLMKDYKQKQTDLLSHLLWKLNVDPSAHATLMERIKKSLNSTKGFDMLDPESFKQITDLIEAEIKSANLGYDEQTTEIMKKMNELNKAMYKDVKDKTENDDKKWKYQLLQTFLLVSPFMGIAYMTPFLNAFSGVFLNADGLGTGIASLATAEHTGIFGAIADALGIDNLIRFILNDVPIINNLVDILNTLTQNTVFQGLATSIVLPAAGGILMQVGIGAAGLVVLGSKELEDYHKYSKIFRAHDKKLVDAVRDIYKNTKNHEESRKNNANKALQDLIDGKIQDSVKNGKPTYKDTKIDSLDHKNLLKTAMGNLLKPNLSKDEIAQKRSEIIKLLPQFGFNNQKRKTVLDVLHKIFDDFHEGPNTTQLVNNIERTLEEAYYNRYRAEFWAAIYNLDKPSANVMRRLLGSPVVERLTEAGVIDSAFHPRKMLEFLVDQKNKDDVRRLETLSLLFCGVNAEKVEDKLIQIEDVLKAANAGELKRIVTIQKEIRRQDFIVERAEAQNIEIPDSLIRSTKNITLEEVLERKAVAEKLRAATIKSAINEMDIMINKKQGVIEPKLLPDTYVGKSPQAIRAELLQELSREAPKGGRGDPA